MIIYDPKFSITMDDVSNIPCVINSSLTEDDTKPTTCTDLVLRYLYCNITLNMRKC
jgi:hypothetical protein